MEFRRSGQRDDRRRRVFLEEMAAAPSDDSTSGDAASASSAAAAYSAAAEADRQPRITDFIPRRPATLAVLLLALLACAAGIESLYALFADVAGSAGSAAPATFAVAGGSGLAAWFSTLLFTAAGLISLLVYTIRRHKADDYRGHYRVWLWAAAAWFLAGADASARIHLAVRSLCVILFGSLDGRDDIWWIGAYGAVLAALGLRLAIEVRACRPALIGLATALVCYLVAAPGWLESAALDGVLNAMLGSSLGLVASVLLLFSMIAYARHVYLDAQGLLPKKQAARRRREKGARKDAAASASQKSDASGTASESASPRRNDLSTPAPAPRPASTGASPSSAARPAAVSSQSPSYDQDDDADDADDDSDANRHLSKAERKRLRKQMRRERRAETY
jgi:hypothetical protein